MLPAGIRVYGNIHEDDWPALEQGKVPTESIWQAYLEGIPPTEDDYLEVMASVLSHGERAICLTPAQSFSQAYTHAQAALATLKYNGTDGDQIRVIDTGIIGAGTGLIAHSLLKYPAEDDFPEKIGFVRSVLEHCQTYFYAGSMESLLANGSRQKIQGWTPGSIHKKSLIGMRNGTMSFLATIPSWEQGKTRMLKLVRNQARLNPLAAVVQYTDDDSQAAELIAALNQGVQCPTLFAIRACPSLCNTLGQGSIALTFHRYI